MFELVKRNLNLYFSSFNNVFLSLMGALISFVLYLLFLKQSIASGWNQVPDLHQILDPWLMGGTLTITAITTTANGLSQMIKDRENGQLRDFLITTPTYLQIQFSYIIGAFVIGFIMQVIIFVLISFYFILSDGMIFNFSWIIPILLVMILSSLVWTVINMLMQSFVKTVDSLGKLNPIIGTAAGFFAGVYMPIGLIPTTAQHLIEFTPAPYNTAIFRQILMDSQLTTSFANIPVDKLDNFKKMMGVGIDINGLTQPFKNIIIMIIFTLLAMIAILFISKVSRKKSVQRS